LPARRSNNPVQSTAMTEQGLPRVLIFIPEDYAAGGIQRSAVAVHDCLVARGYDPTIYCTRLMPGGLAETRPFIRPVAPVKRSKALTWIGYFRGMRKLLREEAPVAAIGLGLFPAAALPIAAAGLSGTLLVGSERAHPPEVPVGRIFALMRRLMFPRLDLVVCQTRQIADWFAKSLRIPADRLAIIPNVVRPPAQDWEPTTFANAASGDPKSFVAVGRLDWQKGFDFALRAFALIVEDCPDARLTIVGEGPLHEELLALRAELQLTSHVVFQRPRGGLASLWREAYVLLFTSRYEGFPNVLAEAMAHGVPAVAFDCPSGPADIVNNGRDGFLVSMGDVETLAKRAIELTRNPAMRDEYARRAMSVSDQFALPRIADQWAALLERDRGRPYTGRPDRVGRTM
jgi:glycosyltransferase involved in cell wall biosynthesis